MLLVKGAFAFNKAGALFTNGNIITLQQGQQVVLHANVNNAAAYQWYNNGVAIPGAVTSDYTVKAAGMYTVTAFNTNSCPSTQSDQVQVVMAVAPPPINPVITTPSQVDIAITKIAEAKPVAIGQDFTYTITVENRSPQIGRAS